jgi:hypothetical protein
MTSTRNDLDAATRSCWGNGAGGFGAAVNFPVGASTGPQAVAVDNCNAEDPHADLTVANFNAGGVTHTGTVGNSMAQTA